MNRGVFEEKLGYTFQDPALLTKALTHSSYIKEKKERGGKNNERLEFLGDAFLDAVISEELFGRLEKEEEGRLTKARALIVCEKSLVWHAKHLDIGQHLFIGKGEEYTGGRNKDALLADAVEAVLGAVYLDGGYETVKKVILSLFEKRINDAVGGKLNSDYKTELQEKLQEQGEVKISYVTDREEGPDHDKTFYVSLRVGGKVLGKGKGKCKKEAEQSAARTALNTLETGKKA